jgi:hypothetical protein
MAPYQTPPPPYREVWERQPDGRALCALIHGDQGWALPVETVERALAHFRRTGERAPFVKWEAE